MLVLGSRFHQTPVMGLQTGTRLAQTSDPLIDPRNLTIVAFEVDGPLLTERPSFLRVNEVREVSSVGLIIDSSDELIGLDDVIAIKKLHDMQFKLIGLRVVDELKNKLGKVEDYTIDTQHFVIQQLHIKRGFIRGLNDTGLLIHRTQIIEITDEEITVKSTAKKLARPVEQSIRHEYVNPFRQPSPQTDSSKLK